MAQETGLIFEDFQIPMSRVPIQYYSYFCEYTQHKKY